MGLSVSGRFPACIHKDRKPFAGAAAEVSCAVKPLLSKYPSYVRKTETLNGKRVDGGCKRVHAARKRVAGACGCVDGPRKRVVAAGKPFPGRFRGSRQENLTTPIRKWNATNGYGTGHRKRLPQSTGTSPQAPSVRPGRQGGGGWCGYPIPPAVLWRRGFSSFSQQRRLFVAPPEHRPADLGWV